MVALDSCPDQWDIAIKICHVWFDLARLQQYLSYVCISLSDCPTECSAALVVSSVDSYFSFAKH